LSRSVVFQQFARTDFQRASHSEEFQQGYVPHTSLDTGHVRTVHADAIRQRLLGDPSCSTRTPNALSNFAQQRMRGLWHGSMLAG
jgi:hypothetical protein